ncbi:MAG: hypothetical protein ACOC8P_00230 [Dichotomicrobium sp.]
MFRKLIGKAAGLTLTGRAAWAAIGAVVLALGWAGWTQWRIGNLHEQLGECRGETGGVVDVANSNAAQLTVCQRRLEAEIEGRELAEQAEREANRQLESETERRRDVAERERAARREAYDHQDCADWARQPVCPDIADSLRRAAGSDRDPGR